MNNTIKVLSVVGSLLATLQTTGCISDDGDDPATGGTAGAGASGGSGGSGTGGSAGTSSTGLPGTVCASPVPIGSGMPLVGDFDTYDGSDFALWKFAFGGNDASGVLAGTFAYGDEATGFPETYGMGEGHESMYGMRIDDAMSLEYGGGMGLWLSKCLDATAFTGISFWVRGNSPSPMATFTLQMAETLPVTPSTPTGPVGGCTGDSTTCKHPTFTFTVSDAWTLVQAPWSGFTAGSAAGTPVTPTGRNVNQLQWGVGLNFVPSDADPNVYVPVPAPYELVVDGVTFY